MGKTNYKFTRSLTYPVISNIFSQSKSEIPVLFLLFLNAAIFRLLTFKIGISPQSLWYGLDTKQYVDMVVNPMLERTGDLNRHPLFSLLLAGPSIIVNLFLHSISKTLLLITFSVTTLVSFMLYALFRIENSSRSRSLLLTVAIINFTSTLYFLPIFEMLSLTMAYTGFAFLLVLIARKLESGRLKLFLFVLSISLPMMVTTPLGIIGIIGAFLYLSRHEFMHSIIYAYFLVSFLFVIQNFIFPPTNFFLNRPPGYYVAENHWTYFFQAPIQWIGSTFTLPILIRDAAPPFFHPLDSADLHLFSVWGLLAICWTLILGYSLTRTWRQGDRFPTISVIFLMFIVQLWGSEPHLQAPYLFPIFSYLFFKNLRDSNSSRFIKMFSYVTFVSTIFFNFKTFYQAVILLQSFNG